MSKHKSEDYKLTTVKYYLDNETTYKNTCDILSSYTNKKHCVFHLEFKC